MKNKMNAIVVSHPGDASQLQLQECFIPECGSHDVLVEVKVAGINYIDVYIRTGLYKSPHYPYIPGKEGSGVVVSVGKDVVDIKPGDRIAFCMGGSGAYTKYTVIPAQQVVLIPDSISFERAAAVMLQGLTAYYLSHLTFELKEEHTALIHAGAGGIGLLLIQMAKLKRAKVIATVSSHEKLEMAKKAGADEVIIYTKTPFLGETKKITQDNGVNVVYDSVGKTTFDDSLASLAIRGMLVSYGQSSGAVPAFELSRLAEKSLFLTRPSLFHYTRTKAELNRMSASLFKLIEADKLQITIGQRYPLKEARKAHCDLESRKTVGKSILVVE